MLLRFAAENIMSFKDTVEFNTFPSSKTRSHDWHKVECGHATALRMSAIYGANGAGKSNLLKCISLVKRIISTERIVDLSLTEDLYFRLDDKCKSKPSELAIEFFSNGHVFYYHIAFTKNEIVFEELLLSQKTKDITLFTRKGNRVEISDDHLSSFTQPDSKKVFIEGINKLIRPEVPLLSFLGNYYPNVVPLIVDAYNWIMKLEVVLPSTSVRHLPHLLDTDPDFAELVNDIVPELKTGITRLLVRKEPLDEKDIHPGSSTSHALNEARMHPEAPAILADNKEILNVIVEDGKAYIKTLILLHKDISGKEVEMEITQESDGTRRLIEYMPLLYNILKNERVFIVDEIERSIHPILIRIVMSKISESRDAHGQIIFTTHESCLLDQSIFRPDEIWFAQKDVDQSTQLYPLSDFNIHNTANIENGYLKGRYGGIPFLSNLTDLKW